eukprot:2531768-Rhodomonas_salina.1
MVVPGDCAPLLNRNAGLLKVPYPAIRLPVPRYPPTLSNATCLRYRPLSTYAIRQPIGRYPASYWPTRSTAICLGHRPLSAYAPDTPDRGTEAAYA